MKKEIFFLYVILNKGVKEFVFIVDNEDIDFLYVMVKECKEGMLCLEKNKKEMNVLLNVYYKAKEEKK